MIGNSIWDDYSHYWGEENLNANEKRCNVDNCDNGDVACDSYHNIAYEFYMLINLIVNYESHS